MQPAAFESVKGGPLNPGIKPLSGLTIVETTLADAPEVLGHAAGLCGRMAADLGARVIRVEVVRSKRSPTDTFLHSGKERRAVEVGEQVGVVADCLSGADAVVFDQATYAIVADRLGGAVAVVIAMSRTAPGPGSEFTIEAQSGLLDLVGDPNREPLRLGGHQIGYSGGLAAYLGMISAISRRKTGQPAGPVRIDLLDIAVWLNWKTLSTALRTGEAPSRAGSGAEWNVVRCADGYVAVVYRMQEWQALKAATGDARLAEDRFQTPGGRRHHRDDLNVILADIFSRMTRAEIRSMALSTKLPLGPVWTPAELLDDPHMRARGFFLPVEIDKRSVAMPTLPVKWDKQTFAPSIESSDAPLAMDFAG